MNITKLNDAILVIEDIFTESSEIIEAVEKSEIFVDAGVLTEGGTKTQVQKEHRDTKTASLKNPKLDKAWDMKIAQAFDRGMQQYAQYMQLTFHDTQISDEGFQMLKYEPNGFYKAHVDGWSAPHRQISGVLYLNDDFEEGEIHFPRQELKYKPKKGSMVIFPSNFAYPHEALPPKGGNRYCIVTWFHIVPPNQRLFPPYVHK